MCLYVTEQKSQNLDSHVSGMPQAGVTLNNASDYRTNGNYRTPNLTLQSQNFGVHTAWRKAKERDTWHQVVSTATLC